MKPELPVSIPTQIPTSIPTNVNLNKVRGHSHSIIRVIGKNMPLSTTTTAIRAELPCLSKQVINSYFKNLIEYGLIQRENYGLYSLTDLGTIQYNTILALSKLVVSKMSASSKLVVSKIFKQLNIDPWLKAKSPPEVEVVVVESLVNHYNETKRNGSPVKFLLVEDFVDICSKNGIDPDVFWDAVLHLHRQGVVTAWPQRKPIKVCLKAGWIQAMENGIAYIAQTPEIEQ